ncbi:MAG: phosphoribosylanthranilate isomerase [Lachnospiraceae bacterium]|nr:phosphoribosylanthranilate isomerase [Lachnospiraceae bacterium]
MQIKICGLFRPVDADYVNEAMPDYAGLVFWEKSRRKVNREQAADLRKSLHPDIRTVGVFVDEEPDYIIELLKADILDIAQLHGQETEEQVCYIKERSGKPVWKAVEVKSADDIEKWNTSAADCLLFDGGKGGGNPFAWELLQCAKRPFFLAGGLDLGRIQMAAELPGLLGIDISSGVETDGYKDREKILQIVRQVRNMTEKGI